MLVSLLAIIVCLMLTIGLHEAGHALAAYWFGVKIKRISIGFGRPLLRWQGKSGCEWVWALWPLGGYVHLLNTRIEPVLEQDYAYCFDKKAPWKRFIILIAGIAVNVVVAWSAFTFIHFLGYKQRAPVVATITSPSIAATAGLQAGDRFIRIQQQATPSWREVGMVLLLNLGKQHVNVEVQTPEGKARFIMMDLSQWHYKGRKNALLGGLGIQPDLSLQQQERVLPSSFFKACYLGSAQLLQSLLFFGLMLKQIITGAIPFAVLLGPFSIFSAMADSLHQGIIVFLYFIGTLSVSVAMINVLPLPGLDGCSMLYVFAEKIRGKPISVALEILLQRLALIVFVLLFVQLLLNDLRWYFQP